MSNKYKNQRNYLKELSVSQNFITSKHLLYRIVGLSTITKDDTVLEIGTGKGHLTSVLSQKCHYLYSIEIDKKLYEKSLILFPLFLR